MFYASFGTAILADAIITFSLYTLLVRSRTGLQKCVLTLDCNFPWSTTQFLLFHRVPDSVVSRLMLFTINTGAYALLEIGIDRESDK